MYFAKFQAMIALSLSAAVSATNLYVSSYTGNITTLSLTPKNGAYDLSKTGSNPQCGPNPSWLTIDNNRGLLFCMNEGLSTANGSLSSFTINDDGSLKAVQNTTSISGPVAGAIYGSPTSRRGIALAHYVGSAVSTFALDGNGKFSPIQNFTFKLDKPGPNPDRQDAPHPHDAVLDPTGQYILVPDLGADLVRIYSWNADLSLTEQSPLQAIKGSGPRHAVFYTPSGLNRGDTYLFLVAELSSTVTSYKVTYQQNRGGLTFEQVFVSSTYGFMHQPPGNAPAEILISPDNRFLLISNRNSSDFIVPVPLNNPNATTYFPQYSYASVNASLQIPQNESSDSISTFRINNDGTLSFLQLAPTGGSWPRSMSLSPDGALLAVGLQYANRTNVYERDVATGLLGNLAASVDMNGPGEGNVTSVVWG